MARNRRTGEMAIISLIWAGAGLVALSLCAIIVYVAVKGAGTISWTFLTEVPRRMGKEGGISSTIVSTVYLTVTAILISAPLGVGAAVHLTEYQQRRTVLTRIIEGSAEALAGIPSIVFGLFGFVFFVIYLKLGWSVLSGGLTLAMMILPTIMRTAQEAIRAVPVEFRENSLALGATRWQTVSRIVLPAALPGIVTGIILSVGRAVGETAAVLLTAGSALGMPLLPSDPARSMSVHLYLLASEGISLERAYGTALLLIVLVITVNYVANLSLRRFSYRLRG
ncbi:MAG: phosphate ABC transporter permease PstA [Syntrophomonadaceae bacterium]|nr:phosphate ABC transporter permease PstA [Syntrophomonadaceae bacterium]MDH7498183.1 phosphate ABC transporter permease PstA [Syntrophomonadaceae bacterium]